jgi:phosphopantetheinyl transferase (holo-ACP synthase)
MNENTNPVDIESLKKCEEIIQRGLHTFWEVGNALLEVRDKQLWAIEYDTFNAYLAGRWKLKPAYAGQLMIAAGIRTELTAAAKEMPATQENGKPAFELPESLAGTVALKNLDTAQKVKVLEQLQAKDLPVTKQNIKKEMDILLPPEPKEEKISYGLIRHSIDALIRQSEFFSTVSTEKVAELYKTQDEREYAIEALTRLVELLSEVSTDEIEEN